MSVGLPIVATAVGGNPEIVKQPDSGTLIPAADAPQLANAILEMCQHTSDWQQMGQQARQRVEQYFNIRTMIKDYENLYLNILTSTQK